MPREVKRGKMDREESLSELGGAIADGDLEYVKMAIATGDDPNCSEEAPLFVATVERQKEIAEFLIEAGADPNLPPDWSCLAQAVAVNDLEWVEFLSLRGARVGAMIPESEHTELHMAARRGQLEMVQLLMEKSGGRQALERFDEIDHTPLMAAAASGQIEVVRYLLDEGANVNALVQMTRDDKIGDTPISCAVYAGHVGVVELLLERGADPYRPGWMWSNAWDQIGKTEGVDYSEMERVLHISELKRPAQTPHRDELEIQLFADLKFHGCHSACSFDWKATKAVGETVTVRGEPIRPCNDLRALDHSGLVVAEGDVDFLVLTREIQVRAFWSRLTIAGSSLELPRGVPEHIVAQLTEDQKSWVVMDRRNYCGRLERADLDRIR
jgi:hypothetical protein